MAGRLAAVPDRPRRMVIYVRQSVARDDSISLEVQERACRDYLAQRGDQVVAVIPDPGVSGLKWDKRRGVQRAMAMIADGHADGIVVWRWSRLSRSRLHQALALDAVERAGGVIESATEPFDTATAGGRFGRDVMLAAAAFESQQKAEQWADAHRRRRERGLPASGGRRFGYLLVDGNYRPDPETGPILAEAYRRYLAGHGLQQIADWLNDLGLASPKAGLDRWSKRGVTYMLDTGWGAGLLHQWSTRTYLPGAHQPVIDELTWQRFRAERARRATVAPRLLHVTTRLSGLVRCECGKTMTIKTSEGDHGRYLRCSERGCPQSRTYVRRDRVEAAVRAWLPTVAGEVNRLAARAPSRSVVAMERARLERQVADAARAIRNLLVDKARSKVPQPVFDEALAELTAEQASAQARLTELLSQQRTFDGATAAAADLMEMWDDGDPVEINALARHLVRVTVFSPRPGSRIRVRGVWEPS